MTTGNVKTDQLEKPGWRFGDAAEFLGLSEREAVYVELKLVLTKKLRSQRKQSNLTQAELASIIRSSQSRVAKMENGDPSVSIDLLIRSLLALGVSRKELGQVIS